MADPLPFIQMPTSVIRDSGLTVMARLLYGVIATYADLRTREATLLRSTLAKDVGRSRDTVDRAVVELVKANLLAVRHRKNDKGVWVASTYTILAPIAANAQVEGGRTDAYTPMGTDAYTGTDAATHGMGTHAGMGTDAATPIGTDAQTVAAPMRPGYGHPCGKEREPLNENQVTREEHIAQPALDVDVPAPEGADSPRSRKRRMPSDPPGFFEFWSIYPRSEDRPGAAAEFGRALKKVPQERLIEAAKRYRDDENREDQFTPYAAKWLKQERWNAGPCPIRVDRSRRPPSKSFFDGIALAEREYRREQANQHPELETGAAT